MRLLTVFISLILVTAVNADEPKSFNPADVTEAASHMETMPEYDKLENGDAYLVRLLYDLDWAEGKYSVSGELPVGKIKMDDGSESSGIGDIRTRFFWKFYDAPKSRLANMVFNLDVFLPTERIAKVRLILLVWARAHQKMASGIVDPADWFDIKDTPAMLIQLGLKQI